MPHYFQAGFVGIGFLIQLSKMKRKIAIWGSSLAVSLFFIFMIKYFLADIFIIPNQNKKSRVLVAKYATIERGNLIIFKKNDSLFSARVVALAGDTVFNFGGEINCSSAYRLSKHLVAEYQVRQLSAFADTVLSNQIKNRLWKIEQLSKAQADSVSAQSWICPLNKKNLNETTVIKENHFFVLNDKQAIKEDSRRFDAINKSEIIGKIIFNLN